MSRTLGHPGPAALASHRVGQAGGCRGKRLSAHIARCQRCARVSTELHAVSATLRDAPSPPMPKAVERRIVTAVEAEATRRQAGQPGGAPRARRAPSLPFVLAPAVAVTLAACGWLLSIARTGPLSPAPVAGPSASMATGQVLPPPAPRADLPDPKSPALPRVRYSLARPPWFRTRSRSW
jgi:hypothetical protein